MTRINVVAPSTLSSKHLVAEYRELPRIFKLAFDAWQRGELSNDTRNPKNYTLGTGHVRFFYNKLGYLRRRFKSLVLEMKIRGMSPAYDDVPAIFHAMPVEWLQDWKADDTARAVNLGRLREKDPEHYND